MQRILTVEQMRTADTHNIEKLGVSGEELVVRAGTAVADEIKKRFYGGRVLVCVGKGNNGADGKVVADILSKTHGYSVMIHNIATGMLKVFDKKFDIIVDCIFGTGLNRAVEGKYKTTIENINASGAYVISCDIPSGINGNNGKVMGVAVKANLTVAIQEYKLGHFLSDAPDYTGEIVLKDIGISVWDDEYVKKTDSTDAKHLFQHKNRNSHKGNFGKACIVGGSKKFSGSVILSASALCALKSGAGYSNLAVPESLYLGYLPTVPECTKTPLKDIDGNIIFDKRQLDELLKYDSIAIGMGMGVSRDVFDTISYLIKNYSGNLLIDADGLNAIAKYGVGVLKNKKCKIVITPHVGEFSRLTNFDKKLILDDPIKYVTEFSLEYGVTVLLKNAVSVITDGKEVYLNTTGCSGMAKGGSGDVLSGFICGLLARSDDVLDCVLSGAYIFGKAGERAQQKQNEFTMTATDIINELPVIINEIL